MSLFPFLILVTALAGFLSAPRNSPTRWRASCCEAWPTEVAIADRERNPPACCIGARGDVLTIGVALAIYFASSGIESLRIGLNRAYGVAETAELVAAAAGIDRLRAGRARSRLLVLSFLVVLAPLIFATAVRYVPLLEPLWFMFNFLRIAVASVVLIVALVIVHKWLPAGRRPLSTIAPGIVATLVLWLIAGELFGRLSGADSPTPMSPITPAWRRR